MLTLDPLRDDTQYVQRLYDAGFRLPVGVYKLRRSLVICARHNVSWNAADSYAGEWTIRVEGEPSLLNIACTQCTHERTHA